MQRQNIRVLEGVEETVIEILSDRPILHTSFRLSEPDRLVLEMANMTLGSFHDVIRMSKGPVLSIKSVPSKELNISRLEIRLSGRVKTNVYSEDTKIVVETIQLDQDIIRKEALKPIPLPKEPEIPISEEKVVSLPRKKVIPLPTLGNLPKIPPPSLTVKKEVKPLPPAKKVSAIELVQGDAPQIVITSDGLLSPRILFVDKKRDRLLIDLKGVKKTILKNRIPGDGQLVKRIRMGQHPKKLRLVIDLLSPVTYSWEPDGNKIKIILEKSE